jgi:hypothetical protein
MQLFEAFENPPPQCPVTHFFKLQREFKPHAWLPAATLVQLQDQIRDVVVIGASALRVVLTRVVRQDDHETSGAQADQEARFERDFVLRITLSEIDIPA